jgi:hypothetical protein
MITLNEIELLQQQQEADTINGLMAIRNEINLTNKVYDIMKSYMKKYDGYESNAQRDEAIKAGIEKRFTLEEAEKDDEVYFQALKLINGIAYFSASVNFVMKDTPFANVQAAADQIHEGMGHDFYGDSYYKNLQKDAMDRSMKQSRAYNF